MQIVHEYNSFEKDFFSQKEKIKNSDTLDSLKISDLLDVIK